MNEKFSLKDALFNPSKIRKVALEIKTVYSDFEDKAFEEEVCHKFPERELKARIYHIRDILNKYLPNAYESAVAILIGSLPNVLDPAKRDNDFGDFIYASYGEFVAMYGCSKEHLRFSLEALRELTKRFSMEFAIRDFINYYPEETLVMLSACALSDNYHERRLASEGLRPKLPWAKKITLDYRAAMIPLDRLFYDKTRYVTRSVANHLNDISKFDAPLVMTTLKKWKASEKQDVKEMDFIIHHALRTLVKQGDKEALKLLGYVKNPAIEVKDFGVNSQTVHIGEALEFGFILEAKEEAQLMLDYIIYFKTKAGALSPKVHKIKKMTLKKGSSTAVEKRHLFRANMSTRTFYTGMHKLELQINGTIVQSKMFELKV